MDDDYGLDDILGDSNAGAYSKREVREGPPLNYVGEKLASALVTLHASLRSMARNEESLNGSGTNLVSVRSAFQYVLVAFCALHNMLSVMSDHQLVERLTSLSRDEFEDWIADIQNEGSVT